ncbi:junctional adhesion molecule-like [Echinops telfairi]|uniref:Junctional adhesion molecule-like n=1 Tax=Echinops telfairi TaxID=9371 RepID=A0ABM0ZSX3_ECHTE|nr:junctional adhesion molecule-like [Echinops telfairi]
MGHEKHFAFSDKFSNTPSLSDLIDDYSFEEKLLAFYGGLIEINYLTTDHQATRAELFIMKWVLYGSSIIKGDYVLYYYANLSVPMGRFLNRVRLVGDISHNEGSLLLQDVTEADQGTYTCEIRLQMESLVFKKEVVLHVRPEEPKELTVHVGESTVMGCVFHSTEEKHVTELSWVFSSGEHAKKETVFHYHSKRPVPVGSPQNQGRFQTRVNLVGDISRKDGSIVLRGVEESDRGNYTCRIRLGNLEVQKAWVLHVLQREPRSMVTPAALPPGLLAGNQLVVIVGIVCTTVLLLAVLLLIMKRTRRTKSSVTSTSLAKSLDATQKVNPEKHVYFSISPQEVTEEEESAGNPEATYMTMHPVWPAIRSAQNNPLEKKPGGEIPKTTHAF